MGWSLGVVVALLAVPYMAGLFARHIRDRTSELHEGRRGKPRSVAPRTGPPSRSTGHRLPAFHEPIADANERCPFSESSSRSA